ncbi:MAG: hypothetical protein A3H51_02940 [Candidatus Spechtbacteria bacterium RIFCSPLOWO2_02_FULL_38_8]|uniref:DUF5667 domain-containing protein n=1 Tax=Candidatus Spechtbacteria bacterium RIFCSPLOWO2_02_FULL_38_8 TaxID=1802164 RepID=A0A1G2HHQ9_9BACT|nr:MAG: hypothetical protein A3H51_02940 [Candidatus Spechtbacteria bacterium RIFCSPLOWO2_02_FULL_38_8]
MKLNKFAQFILPILLLCLFFTQAQGVFATDGGITRPEVDEAIQAAKDARANALLSYQNAKQVVATARKAWEANKNKQTRNALNLAIKNKVIALMSLDKTRITVQILILEKDKTGRWGDFNEIMGSDAEFVNSTIEDLNIVFSYAGDYAAQMGKADIQSEIKGNTAALNELKNEIVAFHKNNIRPAIRRAILMHKLYILKGIAAIAKEGGYNIDSILEPAYTMLRDAFENASDKELFNSVKDYVGNLILKALDGSLLSGEYVPPVYVGDDEPCPLMPTVVTCLEGQKRVVTFSSEKCGIYYGCAVLERPNVKDFPVPKSKDVK